MKDNFRLWNQRQKKLQSNITSGKDIKETIKLISIQNGTLHPSTLTNKALSTMEDEFWSRLSEEDFRRSPKQKSNSIAWHLWHSARVEDVTASFLIVNEPQILETGGFAKSLNIKHSDVGNSMSLKDKGIMNADIHLTNLKKYRMSLGKRTQELIRKFTPELLNRKVSQSSLKNILKNGFVLPEDKWILDFWGSKTIAGIVLMPLTRHLLVHINKSMRLIKKKKD